MKYSYQWLKELSHTQKTPQELAELMTKHAFEVEKIEEYAALSGVIVGEILHVQKHPGADTLSLVQLAINSEKTDIRSIVCGAKNIQVGDHVPVALPGTTLPNGANIQNTVIRGEQSDGMLCAEDELGLGSDHSGIVQLAKDTKIGASFSQATGRDDVIIELSILSNRGHDALSHEGIAREICAIEGRQFIAPDFSLTQNCSDPGLLRISVEKGVCRRYVAALVDGISSFSSPLWMKNRLRLCGIRPINGIVDVTNYVMLELGQPMHAFDADRINNNAETGVSLSVRSANQGEHMVLLDGSEQVLSEGDIVISADKKILALAGVMGGENSGITESTHAIVLEAACFRPTRIRETRMRLRVETESSYRFERELDPNLAERALCRALELLAQFSNARLRDFIDSYSDPSHSWTVQFDPKKAEKLLGMSVDSVRSISILRCLGCNVSEEESGLSVMIPPWRLDLKTAQDLIEEVGRVLGYDYIIPSPLVSIVKSYPKDPMLVLENDIREAFVSSGAHEMVTYALYGPEDIQFLGEEKDQHYSLQDPMSGENAYLRTSLVPSILKKVQENLRYDDQFCLFEIGKTYRKVDDYDPRETRKVSATVVGYAESRSGGDFFVLKGMVERMFEMLRIEKVSFQLPENVLSFMHPARCGVISVQGEIIGYIGEIHPAVAKKMDVKKRTAVMEISLEHLLKKRTAQQFSVLPKYPFVERDISFCIPKQLPAQSVADCIVAHAGSFLRRVELFDIFENGLERSVAFHLWFGSDEKTLGSAEIDGVFSNIVKGVETLDGVKAKIV